MASRTATTPRVTGGRPATMTRSAVQQARTQGRPTTPTPSLDLPEPTVDGWVNVDHHKRKHKPGSSSTTTGATGLVPSTGRVRNPVAVEGNGRDLRRTQSAVDATTVGDEPPIARPNARADALSAAVTMDKKARERSYYANATASGSATSPSNGLSLMPPSTAAWGSPPPPPGLESQRGLHKSTSLVSPDALQLDRGSSLEKLMSSWQLADDAKDSPGRAARQNPPAKASTNSDLTATLGGIFDFSFTEFPAEPPSVTLRRTQSDVVPSTMAMPHNGNRQRSPTGRLPAEAKTNGNTNGNGNANANGNTASRKCGDKRDFFFRNLDFETRSLLQIDEVASFSVTDFEMARKISSAIVDLFPEMKAYVEQQAAAASGFYDSFGGGNGYYYDPSSVPQPPRKYPLIITDATACVGGNVLSFCDFFHFVYAIENDATRVAMLENNLRVLQKTNVACRCASYLDVMYEYHQDVIFFDPPWGGPEYKDQDKVDLYLDEQPLYEICEQLHGYAKVIVLKVPTNFDDEKFAYCVSGRVTVRKDFKKMHLVVLDFR